MTSAAAFSGNYSLCSFSVQTTEATDPLASARHAIPAVLLARLAVDRQAQGIGVGSYLLLDSLRVSPLVADHVGARLMVVHALNAKAAEFYRQLWSSGTGREQAHVREQRGTDD